MNLLCEYFSNFENKNQGFTQLMFNQKYKNIIITFMSNYQSIYKYTERSSII